MQRNPFENFKPFENFLHIRGNFQNLEFGPEDSGSILNLRGSVNPPSQILVIGEITMNNFDQDIKSSDAADHEPFGKFLHIRGGFQAL